MKEVIYKNKSEAADALITRFGIKGVKNTANYLSCLKKHFLNYGFQITPQLLQYCKGELIFTFVKYTTAKYVYGGKKHIIGLDDAITHTYGNDNSLEKVLEKFNKETSDDISIKNSIIYSILFSIAFEKGEYYNAINICKKAFKDRKYYRVFLNPREKDSIKTLIILYSTAVSLKKSDMKSYVKRQFISSLRNREQSEIDSIFENKTIMSIYNKSEMFKIIPIEKNLSIWDPNTQFLLGLCETSNEYLLKVLRDNYLIRNLNLKNFEKEIFVEILKKFITNKYEKTRKSRYLVDDLKLIKEVIEKNKLPTDVSSLVEDLNPKLQIAALRAELEN